MCYIIAGAFDLINVNENDNTVTLNWDSQLALTRYYDDMLREANGYILEKYPASKVVFCPMVGMELSKVVSDADTVKTKDQIMVDGAVWEFNSKVRSINNKNDLKTPFLLTPIHRHANGKKKTYYHHLNNGKDPSDYIMDKWAKALVHACNLI